MKIIPVEPYYNEAGTKLEYDTDRNEYYYTDSEGARIVCGDDTHPMYDSANASTRHQLTAIAAGALYYEPNAADEQKNVPDHVYDKDGHELTRDSGGWYYTSESNKVYVKAQSLNLFNHGIFGTDSSTGGSLLRFTASSDSSSVTLSYYDGSDVYYRKNGEEWNAYSSGTTISLNKDEYVDFKGTSVRTDITNHFTMTGSIAASGSVTSLTDGVGASASVELNTSCYAYMFYGCTSLTTAPSLPATTLTSSCYQAMFSGCTALATAPSLPATTLAENCYYAMFSGCTSLTTAPTLLASSLVTGCYGEMFKDCSSLAAITTKQTSFTGCTDWVSGVAATGTFNCPSALDTSMKDASHVPFGWTVAKDVDVDIFSALKFTAQQAGSTVKLIKTNTPSNSLNLIYSTDGDSWNTYNVGTVITLANENDYVYIVAGTEGNSTINTSGTSACYYFSMDGKIAASGNINSLLNSATPTSVTSLPGYCYFALFYNCTSLTTAPSLPATTLAEWCYGSMFEGCISLTTAPELPATTLAEWCYYAMFSGCSSLNYMRVAFTEWDNFTYKWVEGVGEEGTFHCAWVRAKQYGEDYIPEGWSVVYVV